MRAFLLSEEAVEAFRPILPDDVEETDLENGVLLLGAADMDENGIEHACGALVLQVVNEGTMLIKWVLVAPQWRRRGAGQAMMEEAVGIAARLNMQLLCVFSESPDAERTSSLYHILEQNGFRIFRGESKSYSIAVGDIGKESFFQREVKSASGIMTLDQLSERQLARFNRMLEKQGSLLVNPISKEWALGDISVVQIENGEISACAIFEQIDEQTVSLAFVYSSVAASMQLLLLLCRAYQLLSRKYNPEAELVIHCVTETSCKLVEKLMPSAKAELISYNAWLAPDDYDFE